MANLREAFACEVVFTILLLSIVQSLCNTHLAIIGGKIAKIGQFPYQISIRYKKPDGDTLCGGSLISNRWILSAAHCSIRARGGTVFLGSINFCKGVSYQIQPKDIFWHPEFNVLSMLNDICLIQIPFTSYSNVIRNVLLPYIDDARTYESVTAVAGGWGFVNRDGDLADTLQYAEFNVMKNEDCKKFDQRIERSQLCVATTKVTSPCKGDSGGPLVYDSPDGPLQIGIESFGIKKDCDQGYPVGYTRVSFYLTWIRDITGIERKRISQPIPVDSAQKIEVKSFSVQILNYIKSIFGADE